MPHKRKRNNGRGETLVETLIALLISAISLIMFANMLAPAVNLTKKGESWNAEINKLNTPLEERRTDTDVTQKNGTITIATESGENLIDANTEVKLYIADTDKYSGERVISYGLP